MLLRCRGGAGAAGDQRYSRRRRGDGWQRGERAMGLGHDGCKTSLVDNELADAKYSPRVRAASYSGRSNATASHFLSHDAFARTPADHGPAPACVAGRSGGTRGASGRRVAHRMTQSTPHGESCAGAVDACQRRISEHDLGNTRCESGGYIRCASQSETMNRIDSPQRQRFAMLFVRVVVLVL